MVILADIFETIVGTLFLIVWIAAQILGSRQEAKKKPKPARPRPQQPPPMEMAGDPEPQPQQAPKPPNQEEALRSEVEEFLRRAQGKPPKPKPTPQPAAERKPQPPRPMPLRREPVAPVPTRTLRSEGVAEHVARHLSTQDIAERTKTLGADVATSDDRLESHLHEKFDHQLGSLQHYETTAEANVQEGDIAAEVAAMLRSPQSMRQVIIANEVLRRPEW